MDQERAFIPKTFVDNMFVAVVLYTGAATRFVVEPASRVYDNLQGIRRVEAEHILDMLGLRVRKIRPRATGRRYYK